MSVAEADRHTAATRRFAKKLGLRLVSPHSLSLGRRRRGKLFGYLDRHGNLIRDRKTIDRLASLAVPPAYENVRYAADPKSHLQAVGVDAAGRLQYRYHPDWEKVREVRKAKRLSRLVEALPKIRRAVTHLLKGSEPTREFAFAAVVELVSRTAIRPGGDAYVRERGTRGAATLRKSHVTIDGRCIVLSFVGKGGKHIRKECDAPVLLRAIKVLRKLPGPRLFQYRGDDGAVHRVHAAQVNVFLREIAGTKISLKDLRTLTASAAVLDSLARVAPAESAKGRKRQVLEAVKQAADELANTPTICRKSYVHATVVSAFEDGKLSRFADKLRSRSPARREQVLAQVVAAASI